MAGLFDPYVNAGQRIAEVTAAERARLPALIAPPSPPPRQGAVFEIEQGAYTPPYPQRFGPAPTAPVQGATGQSVASSAPAMATAPTTTVNVGGGPNFMDALNTARTGYDLATGQGLFGDIFNVGSAALGGHLNAAASLGPGALSNALPIAAEYGAFGPGAELFGALGVPAASAAVPSSTALASGAGFGAAAPSATAGAGAALGTAALAAAPIALPFVLSGLFGDKTVWDPVAGAQSINDRVAQYQANPDPTQDELNVARQRLSFDRGLHDPSSTASAPTDAEVRQMAQDIRLQGLWTGQEGVAGMLARGEPLQGQDYAAFESLISPDVREYARMWAERGMV